MKKHCIKIALVFLLLLCLTAEAELAEKHAPLISKNENVLLSFETEKTAKTMTLAVSSKGDYIVYRFGTKTKIELEFPDDKKNSWKEFTYSYYFRGGGHGNAGLDLNYLVFTNKDYTYKVYEEYSAEEDETVVGIRVKDKKGQEFEIKGNSASRIGTLADLRFNRKIKSGKLD